MKTIVYCGSFWSTNIGNAFFNLGIVHALKKALPNYNIAHIGDPALWFWNTQKASKANNVLIEKLDCEYIVISGPLFCIELVKVWRESLLALKNKGVKIVFLSAGSMEYTPREYQVVKEFLEELRPHLLITRDSESYEKYSKYFDHSHDGICFAFFSSDYYPESLKIESKDIVVGFDKGHDYNVIQKFGPNILALLENGNWDSEGKQQKFCRKRSESSRKSLGDYRLVRPHHVSNPRFRTLVKSHLLGYAPYKRPNCYAADIPLGYLCLYRNAKITISERVHGCVPALSFGNYAWLISDTQRSRLFSRVGLDDITNRPVQVDIEMLIEEKIKMISVLSDVL